VHVSAIPVADLTEPCSAGAAIPQFCFIGVGFFFFLFFGVHLPFQPAGGATLGAGRRFFFCAPPLSLPPLRFQVCAALRGFVPLPGEGAAGGVRERGGGLLLPCSPAVGPPLACSAAATSGVPARGAFG